MAGTCDAEDAGEREQAQRTHRTRIGRSDDLLERLDEVEQRVVDFDGAATEDDCAGDALGSAPAFA